MLVRSEFRESSFAERGRLAKRIINQVDPLKDSELLARLIRKLKVGAVRFFKYFSSFKLEMLCSAVVEDQGTKNVFHLARLLFYSVMRT